MRSKTLIGQIEPQTGRWAIGHATNKQTTNGLNRETVLGFRDQETKASPEIERLKAENRAQVGCGHVHPC